MPTTFYLRAESSSLGGAGQKRLSQRRGAASTNLVTNTTSGGTNITVTDSAGGTAQSWFSEPMTEAFTLIGGGIQVNIRGRESANTVNAGRGILIERCNNAGTVLSTIVADSTVPPTISEYTTTDAVNGVASYTDASVTLAVGERIKVTLKVRNVGTMGVGTVTNSINSNIESVSGDTYITFPQNVYNLRTDEVLDTPAFEIQGSNAYYG